MPEDTPLETAVEQAMESAVNAPLSVSNTTGSLTSRSLQELIAMDRYIKSRQAAANPLGSLQFATLRTGGPF